MKLIRFISTLVVVAFLMAAIGSSAWAAGTKRPNIIFILTDDISPKDYAFHGGKTASPVLEKMAKEGLYFKTAWATPRCVPTRAMLLTGKYAFRTRVFENQVNPRGADNRMKPVGERFPNTLGSLMTANGYRTAMIGKIQTGTVQSYGFQRWCLVNHHNPVRYFDMSASDNNVDGKRVFQPNVHSTDSLFEYLHKFTAEKADDPWFVYMPLNLPHFVRNPNLDAPNKWIAPIVPELDENGKKTGKLVLDDFGACIRYIDYKIGRFVEHLRTTGQLENTIIMYAGDNGSGTYGKSNPDSEKGPRVPFVVYAPGYLKPMGACDELVDLTDVVPTCVELAGGSLPKGDIFDGHSFAPLIQGKPFEGRPWIFTQWYGCRWLRTKQWLIDGRGRFYDCGDHRNEWVPGAYKDVTESVDEPVIAVRKNLERILETMPAPDYDDPELAAQWQKEWFRSRRFVQPYVPPYLESALSEENLDLLFNDPPNEYRIVKYQLNDKALVQYPRYGFGGYQPFFYDNLYKAGPTGPSTIGPLVDAANAQGRTVWSADDAGYPSGSAGGNVVVNNPEYEVRGVAMLTTTGSGQVPVSISTPSDCEKMISAVLYPVANGVPDFSQGQVQPVQDTGVNTTGLTGEWKLCAFILKIRDTNTQCADRATRFGVIGRYPDLLNPKAVASWISLMHEPIIAQITDPASQLEGFYFNEPSLQQLNEYTGRISVMLTGARIATPVALYYPIEMFQMEYKPITARHFGKWNTRRQVAWDNLQTTMLDAEVDYNIVHPEWVRDAAIESGELKIGSGCYRYLVMPDVEVISSKMLATIQQFEAGGGTVLWVDGKPMAGDYPSEDARVVRAVAGVETVSAAQVPGLIPNPYNARFTLNVTSRDSLLTTRFKRQGRSIFFLVNPTGSSITAHLDDINGGLVKVYDPVTGKITRMPLPTDVVIDAYKSVLSVPVTDRVK